VECYPVDKGSWRSDLYLNQNKVSHSRREHTHSPLTNGASLGRHWLWAVLIDCNCKEVPINPIIQSRTCYIRHAAPSDVTIITIIIKTTTTTTSSSSSSSSSSAIKSYLARAKAKK
jgi:hypothetical protein